MPATALLDKGKYKVVEVLCISKSLYSQKHTDGSGSLHKALLQNASGYKVVYFIDPIDFGAGSSIFIKDRRASPLLPSTGYAVTCKRSYRTNVALVEKLLASADPTKRALAKDVFSK